MGDELLGMRLCDQCFEELDGDAFVKDGERQLCPICAAIRIKGLEAEIERLRECREWLELIVAAHEPYDARDCEWGDCLICQADCGKPHKADCSYVAALRLFAPEWRKDSYEPNLPDAPYEEDADD